MPDDNDGIHTPLTRAGIAFWTGNGWREAGTQAPLSGAGQQSVTRGREGSARLV